MARNIYFEERPWEEALAVYLEHLKNAGALTPGIAQPIPAEKAVNRITATAVYAKTSSPHYHAAAMDGFAVEAALTFGATETKPKKLVINQDVFAVDTGDPLPSNCNAVIMIEKTHFTSPDIIEITQSVYPWQHVRIVGEDIVATEMILGANHRIRPIDIGGIMAGGLVSIAVHPKPKVILLPTGSEMVKPGTVLKPGQIIDSNTYMLAAMIEEWGGQALRREIVVDDPAVIKEALSKAITEADLVLIIAGSAKGREDFTADVIKNLGTVLVHGIATRPGKPVILGIVKNKPVVGIPGYPVSAYLAATLFVKPVVYHKLGLLPRREQSKVNAVLTRKIISPAGAEEFVRVKLGQVGERLTATPISRGAGIIMSLIRADGIIRVPRLTSGYQAGEIVPAELLRSLPEIKETTVIIGSHDLTLDILANHLQRLYPAATLSSAHVGSLAGLNALKRKEAHCAGIHLLDEKTSIYNWPDIKRYLPEQKVTLVNLVYREQGLMIRPGNPKKIKDLTDLTRANIIFINRQRGAGTRILLDYFLKKLKLEPKQINGYQREEYTHMAIAAAVASGVADVGLGIYAAARALELDFIPLAEERYDLCIPQEFWETPYIQRLLSVMLQSEFQNEVKSLGGYNLRDCGNIIVEE